MASIESRKQVCCNCGRNIRVKEGRHIECHCEVDGHYIGYNECFTGWCPKWKRETKWDKLKGESK